MTWIVFVMRLWLEAEFQMAALRLL
eukprot:COSAG02_NODE_68210_length_251_cov_0.677632_1_plen_24_part_10